MSKEARSTRSGTRLLRLLVCTTLLAAFAAPVAPASAVMVPTQYYVDALHGSDLTGTGAVTSPFKSITRGVLAAGSGNTVHIAPGAYSPATTDESFPLELPSGITLTGTGGRDVTVVDGQGYSGIFVLAGSTGVTVDGLCITRGDEGGFAPDGAPSAAAAGAGGAIDVFDDGGLVVTRSRFTSCSASFGGAISAVYGVTAAELLIEDTEFEGCSAFSGGAIRALQTSMTVRDSTFEGCSAILGGAVDAADGTAVFERCAFDACGWWPEGAFAVSGMPARSLPWTGKGVSALTPLLGSSPLADEGGAVRLVGMTSEMKATSFTGNIADALGAAVAAVDTYLIVGEGSIFDGNYIAASGSSTNELMAYGVGAGIYVAGVLDASDTSFFDNGAPYGGAIYSEPMGSALVQDSTFEQNYALTGSSLSCGGSFAMPFRVDESIMTDAIAAQVEVDRCTFTGDWLAESLLHFEDAAFTRSVPIASNVKVHNSLFTGNDMPFICDGNAFGVDYSGLTFAGNNYLAAVAQDGDFDATLTNSVAWGNEPFEGGMDPLRAVPALLPAEADVVGHVDVGWCDLQNGFEGTDLGGNISADPLFASPAGGDFRLKLGSPCIDTGAPGVTDSPDLDSLDRPTDGDYSGSDEYDMGAYEFEGGSPIRIGGIDRYATSVDVCQARYAFADTVVIATGRQFADGLAASGLCGAYDAPLLLTVPTALPGVVRAEIERLGAKSAIIVGGTGAVSKGVQDTLVNDLGLEVLRIGGADRYDTAAAIAAHMLTLDPAPGVIFVARGDRFADALTVAPVAWSLDAPVVLVEPTEMPESTFDVVMAADSSRIVIIGGTGAVDAGIERDMRVGAQSVQRISGADRYETSANFSEFAVSERWATFDAVGIATGLAFPDALCGGPSLGAAGGVMMLTPSDSLHPAVEHVLTTNITGHIEVLGGPAAVSPGVFATLMGL